MNLRYRAIYPIACEIAIEGIHSIAVDTERDDFISFALANQISEGIGGKYLSSKEYGTASIAPTVRENLFRDSSEISSKNNALEVK